MVTTNGERGGERALMRQYRIASRMTAFIGALKKRALNGGR